jgi:hypothetical protein
VRPAHPPSQGYPGTLAVTTIISMRQNMKTAINIIFDGISPLFILYLLFIVSPQQLTAEENAVNLLARIWLSIMWISFSLSIPTMLSGDWQRKPGIWDKPFFYNFHSRYSRTSAIFSIFGYSMMFIILAAVPYGIIRVFLPAFAPYRYAVTALNIIFWGYIGARYIPDYIHWYKEKF